MAAFPFHRVRALLAAAVVIAVLTPGAPGWSSDPVLPLALIGTVPAEAARRVPSLDPIEPPLDFGPMIATHVQERARVAGLTARLYLQVDRSSGRVRQILLERRRPVLRPEDFAALHRALTNAYGAPLGTCGSPTQGRRHTRWRVGATMLHLIHIDDTARGIARFDPNTDSDPRARASDRLRVRSGSLPKRLILRAHAAADTALGGPSDCR